MTIFLQSILKTKKLYMSGGFLIFKKFFWILFFQFFIFKFWKIFKKYFWILKSSLFIFYFFNSIHFAKNKLLRGRFYGLVRLKRSIINRTCLTIFNAKLHPFCVFFSIGNVHEKIWRQNLGSQKSDSRFCQNPIFVFDLYKILHMKNCNFKRPHFKMI